MHLSISRLVAATGLGLGLTLGPAQASPVELVFEPPAIEPQDICLVRDTDAVIVERWQKWQGESLEGWPATQVISDLARLAELDPEVWYPKAIQAIALLPAADPEFDRTDQILTQIQWMTLAGKQSELTNLRLVPELLAIEGDRSARRQRVLGALLLRGTGISPDREKGLQFLVNAANGGNADAILELVSIQLTGAKIAGWDVAPDLGVTMAFGALVGQLDPEICSRVTRIAREYKNGDVVATDLAMSERWYRFAADLGDLSAAWKVAEMHLRSEAIAKDNDILLHYLTKAAEGGHRTAMVNLGRIYETGALVEQDLVRALNLYQQAADLGDRGGKIRLTMFRQARAKDDPAEREKYLAALNALVSGNGAPAWALMAAADEVLIDKGRWGGEAEALAYLQRAADQGDTTAQRRLIGFQMRGVTDPQQFYSLADQLASIVQAEGKIDPMLNLRTAFICRAPDAPVIDEAEYWNQVIQATGIETVRFGPEELLELSRSSDPLTLARLQSQAVSGRASAVAQYLTLIEKGDFSVVEKDFWESYAKEYPDVMQSRGRLALSLARTYTERQEALDMFREAVKGGELRAGLYLARAILKQEEMTAADRAEAIAMLMPLAEMGQGAAMALLTEADPDNFPDLVAVRSRFGEIIDQRGDFDAMLVALEAAETAEVRQDYLNRAIVETACRFDQTAQLADVLGRLGDEAGFRKWWAISEYLAEGNAWRLGKLGDLLARHGKAPEDAARVLELHQAAYEKGDRVSMLRLLTRYADAENPAYDPLKSTEVYIALVMASRPGDLPELLTRIGEEETVIRKAVMSAVDPEQIFRVAAEAGDPVAMREYAFILRENSPDADQIVQSGVLLAKASEMGDVEAMVEYAVSLAFGVGVEPSRDEALMWLNKAAEMGNQRALTLVATLGLTEGVTQ